MITLDHIKFVLKMKDEEPQAILDAMVQEVEEATEREFIKAYLADFRGRNDAIGEEAFRLVRCVTKDEHDKWLLEYPVEEVEAVEA